MNDSRRRRKAGNIYAPDLHRVVISAAGEAELAGVKGNGPHSIEMTGGVCQYGV